MPDRRTVIGGGGILALALSLAVPQIEKFEGLRHRTYPDIGGILSICYGHTGPDVRVNTYYSTDKCYTIAQQDATKAADAIIVKSPILAQHPYQLAAAISFAYNVGVANYDKSSVAKDFNAGKLPQGCNDLMKYTYAGGKYSEGLYNRRKAEYAICMKGLTNASVSSPAPSAGK